MANITVENLFLSYPVILERASIRKAVINTLLGGLISRTEDRSKIITVDAIRGISFEISDGERVGLIGHNGAGKTSLLRVLATIYQPTSGLVKIKGQVESLIDVGFGLEPEETGRENIKFILTLLGKPQSELDAEVEEIINFTELGEFIDLPVRTYSTGMSTRLSFAIATNIQPEILLMDEVIGAGDLRFQEKAEKRIEEMTKRTKIIFLASHSEGLIKDWCNKVIWMEKGTIVDIGTPEEMWSGYIKSATS